MELLIDGTNLLHKLYHALPDPDRVPDQLRRWLNLLSLQYRPDFVRIALDCPGENWRTTLCPEYKASRDEKPEALQQLLDDAENILSAWCPYAVAGHEADDLLATWAARAHRDGRRAVIVSGDKDLFQCLRHDQVTILRSFRTHRGRIEHPDWFTFRRFVDRYQFVPPAWPQYRALVGDKSDNLPGVPGIGDQNAMRILTLFATVEDAIAAIRSFQTTMLPRAVERALLTADDDGSLARQIRVNTLTKNVSTAATSAKPEPNNPPCQDPHHASNPNPQPA